MQKIQTLGSVLLLSILCACGGGGGGGGGSSGGGSSAPPITIQNGQTVDQRGAVRLLAQASFGPTTASINEVVATNVDTWIEREFVKPQSSHLSYVDTRFDERNADSDPNNNSSSRDDFYESFWRQAITGDDQLRQRVTFALSQLFVISSDSDLSGNIRGLASYYDMLGRNAFGNYRTLLEDVSLHPSMGIYLSHIRNQKEDVARGRVPDENYAREVMQLFSIGLYRLNTDGSVQTSGGAPIETYTNDDVSGLAKVFTGWSWGGPDKADQRFYGNTKDANRDVIPMQGYPKFHSVTEKKFLGVTIPAQSTANPEGDLKIALDALFNHPNTPPFISKQLIQRMVTSNPSAGYVQRVSNAFITGRYNGLGSGERGDMKAVLRAILLDAEARTASSANSYGKLREPLIRLTHWARAFGATSTTGRFSIREFEVQPLGQVPLRSPSVFNFYRPGYVPSASLAGAQGLTVPEMQITHETSTASYVNRIHTTINTGIGNSNDVRSAYAAELALADDPVALVNRIDLLLMAGSMQATTRKTIEDAVRAITVRTNTPANTTTDRTNRVKLAILLAMAAPEYIVQK